jgi:hypothetical protein
MDAMSSMMSLQKIIMQLLENYMVICGPTINMQLNLNLKIEIWTRYAKANDMLLR